MGLFDWGSKPQTLTGACERVAETLGPFSKMRQALDGRQLPAGTSDWDLFQRGAPTNDELDRDR